MKYLAQHFLLSVLLLSSVTFCHAEAGCPQDEPPPPAAEYSPNSWKEFSPPDSSFEIFMPGKPTYLKEQINNQVSQLPQHIYYLDTGAGEYVVSYLEFPTVINDPQAIRKMLDAGRDNMLAKGKKKLLSEKEIKIEGYDGREMIVEDADTILRARTFIAGSRAYHIALSMSRNAVFKTGRPSANPADRTDFYETTSAKFLDSFKLKPSSQEELGEVDRYLRDNKAAIAIGAADTSNSNAPLKPISGGVLDGKALSMPQPTYPAIARAARASGTVAVKVVIDEEGKVVAAQAVSGHPLLFAASVKAAREARFSTTKLDGKPVKVVGIITYNFLPAK